jgi:ABC-type glycerol-3-phosphate transport system substrate-binding protein
MKSFKEFLVILEASYAGNIGISELMKFYDKAPPDAVKKFKEHVANKENDKAWDLVQKHAGVQLHSSAFANPNHQEDK